MSSSLCSLQETADALKVPRRPTVEAVHVGPHKKSTRSGEEESTSQMYKIFLAQPANEEPTVIAESTCTSTIIRDIERAERIELLEIFSCVQKLNSPEITRWRQIAEVDLRKKYKTKEKKGDGKNPSSVKIAGFSSGFRYQIVVRAVGPHGKRSLFSKPVLIEPPQ